MNDKITKFGWLNGKRSCSLGLHCKSFFTSFFPFQILYCSYHKHRKQSTLTGFPTLYSAEEQNHISSKEGTEAVWWGVQISDNRFCAVVWFRGEAEPYSILTALGKEQLKIALINSAVVMLQQSDLRETFSMNTGERLITSFYIKCHGVTGTNDAIQQRKYIYFLSSDHFLDLFVMPEENKERQFIFTKPLQCQCSENVAIATSTTTEDT